MSNSGSVMHGQKAGSQNANVGSVSEKGAVLRESTQKELISAFRIRFQNILNMSVAVAVNTVSFGFPLCPFLTPAP